MAIVRIYMAEQDDSSPPSDTASGGGGGVGGEEKPEPSYVTEIQKLVDAGYNQSSGTYKPPAGPGDVKYGLMPAQPGAPSVPAAGGTPLFIPEGPRKSAPAAAPMQTGGIAPSEAPAAVAPVRAPVWKGLESAVEKGATALAVPGAAISDVLTRGIEYFTGLPPTNLLAPNVRAFKTAWGLGGGGETPAAEPAKTVAAAGGGVAPDQSYSDAEIMKKAGASVTTPTPAPPAEEATTQEGKTVPIPEGWQEARGMGPTGEKMIQRTWTDEKGGKHIEIKPLEGSADVEKMKRKAAQDDEKRINELMDQQKQGHELSIETKKNAIDMFSRLYTELNNYSLTPERQASIISQMHILAGVLGGGGGGGAAAGSLPAMLQKKEAAATREENAKLTREGIAAQREATNALRKEGLGLQKEAGKRAEDTKFRQELKDLGKTSRTQVLSPALGVARAIRMGRNVPEGWKAYAKSVMSQADAEINLMSRRLGRDLSTPEKERIYLKYEKAIEDRVEGE